MAIESPCVQVCVMDADRGLCVGCGRSADEIAAWRCMSAPERARVMVELERRLARSEPGQPATPNAR